MNYKKISLNNFYNDDKFFTFFISILNFCKKRAFKTEFFVKKKNKTPIIYIKNYSIDYRYFSFKNYVKKTRIIR